MITTQKSFWITVVHEHGALYDTDIALFSTRELAYKAVLKRLAELLDYKLTGDDEWDWEEIKSLLRDSDVVYAITEHRPLDYHGTGQYTSLTREDAFELRSRHRTLAKKPFYYRHFG